MSSTESQIYECGMNYRLNDFIAPEAATSYLSTMGLLDLLRTDDRSVYPPVFADLARLHFLLLKRRTLSVLEFGSGWSTLVAAHALRILDLIYGSSVENVSRRQRNFHVDTVDESKQWSEVAKSRLPSILHSYVSFHTASVEVGTYNGRLVTRYSKLPDITPDFIYIDGPSVKIDDTVDLNGLTIAKPWRMPCSADLLFYEYQLEPGALVLTDGRKTNARFLRDYLSRNWIYQEFLEEDISILELQETPIGKLNEKKLEFCLNHEWTLPV